MLQNLSTTKTAANVTFRLAHISDVHLGPLPEVKRRELLSKRITGYINWQRNRAKVMGDDTLEVLVRHMKEAKPDHIAVTGDLVNLALDAEIDLARSWLERLGPPKDISVVPGNHDTYVPGALARISQEWREFMQGDKERPGNLFPYWRVRDHVALLGANSGRATLPFLATGSFKAKQAKALGHLLQDSRTEGLFRVVMIHHPPFEGAISASKRLIGAKRFREVIRRYGAELVLHGHTHLNSFEWIDGPDQPVPVIGVPSASQRPTAQDEKLNSRHTKPAARYNLFDISGAPGNWSCEMQEIGFSQGTRINEIARRDIFRGGKACP